MANCYAYIADLDDGPDSGVGKKVIAQASSLLLESGDKCTVLIFSTDGANRTLWSEVCVPGLHFRVVNYGKSVLLRHVITLKVVVAFLRMRPKIVYSRHLYFYVGLYFAVLLFPFVFEINTDDLGQLKGRRFVYWYHRLTRWFYLSSAVGFVFVSNYLRDLPSFARYRCPVSVIGNGYDAVAIDWDRLSMPDAELDSRFSRFDRNAFFIGASDQSWQGIDKIIKMARGLPHCGFHLVGKISLDSNDIPSNVFLYGFIPLSQYQHVIARCDVAIGTMALHRKFMSGTSALKVAEYIAFKKPVILAYREDDLPENADYLLVLPNVEDNVASNIDRISSFIDIAPSLHVPDEIVSKMSMANKNRQRALFLRSILRIRT